MNIQESTEYRSFGYNIVICPVCGNKTLDNHYICPTCGWEYDGLIDIYTPSPSNGNVTISQYLKWFESSIYGDDEVVDFYE